MKPKISVVTLSQGWKFMWFSGSWRWVVWCHLLMVRQQEKIVPDDQLVWAWTWSCSLAWKPWQTWSCKWTQWSDSRAFPGEEWQEERGERIFVELFDFASQLRGPFVATYPNPIPLEKVRFWHPLPFSLYLRHGFCSESEDVEGNRVKVWLELTYNRESIHLILTTL